MVRSGDVPGADLEAAAGRVIKVVVKTPRQKEEFVVPENSLIQAFKEGVSARFSSPTGRLVLIFAGRILKDHKTLGEHGIHDESTIHLVIQSRRKPLDGPGQHAGSTRGAATVRAENSRLSRPGSASSTAFGTDGLQELVRTLGLNTANFAEFQRQLTSNPEMMLRLLENPFIQSRLSNPCLMAELITDNPLKQQVIQKIPEISRVLNTPKMLRLMLELARSPATVREIMENPSQALSFLASTLGGTNSLPQVCSEPQGLTPRAAPAQGGSKPLASLRSNQSPPRTRRAPSPQACSPPSHSHASSSSISDCTAQSCREPDPDLGRGASAAVSTTIKSLLQQIVKQLVQNILSAPGTRGVRRSLSQNPQLGAQTLPKSPATAGKPPAQPLPTFHQPVWHPEGRAAVPSPHEMQALAQIQQRLQALAMGEPGVPPQHLSPLAGLEHTGGSAERAPSNSGLNEVAHPASSARSQQFTVQQMLQALAGANPQHAQNL